ncbi:hypothetical protein N7532_009274 [Penicillium argentinense]|uniref:LysM domain-containing protein n=1 Tax=Penicillium argentinense TaxID=1131581 RepID=A0A9W9EZ46_9EURO|nr:uncharacterized protein N7532_009274 [Penicillium argentinense]KAJ5090590.1 hypothetical protein N7532_009274 [Penicillium argentinense]
MPVLYAHAFIWTLGLASLAMSAPAENIPSDKVSTQNNLQMTPLCDLFYEVQTGDTCWDIIVRNENTFTMRELLCWNPDINPVCTNLIPGRDICVGVLYPGPTC